jgi:hypothetical protein
MAPSAPDDAPSRAPLWLVGFAVLACVGLVAALQVTEPLPPTTTPLLVVPPLCLGLYLAVASTWIRDVGLYGSLLSWAPEPVHAGMQAVGTGLVALAMWTVLSLPPAGAGRVARALPELDAFCVGPPDVRLERRVLPRVEALLDARSAQSVALQSELDAALTRLFDRCGQQAAVAFRDPQGTHASWRRLRDWLADHPDAHGLSDDHPVFTTDYRPRRAAPTPSVPVPVVLE